MSSAPLRLQPAPNLHWVQHRLGLHSKQDSFQEFGLFPVFWLSWRVIGFQLKTNLKTLLRWQSSQTPEADTKHFQEEMAMLLLFKLVHRWSRPSPKRSVKRLALKGDNPSVLKQLSLSLQPNPALMTDYSSFLFWSHFSHWSHFFSIWSHLKKNFWIQTWAWRTLMMYLLQSYLPPPLQIQMKQE